VTFAWPLALLGLLVLPLAVLLYVVAQRRRRREAERFGTPPLVAGLVSSRPRWRRHVPFALALLALAALVVGVARPHATVSVPREEATVVLAIDTSRSMAADDVRPTRLEAAREAARAFLEQVPERYRVSLVSFSSEAQMVLPPTADREAARQAVAQLRLGSGTALGDAIVRSVQTVRPEVAAQGGQGGQGAAPPDPESQVPATVLLLSDGEQTAGRATPEQGAALARSLGIPVSTVALGVAPTVVEVPLAGGLRERVTVQPDPQTLRTIAQQTGGRFYEAPDADSLQEVYAELGSRLGSTEEERELTQLFAAAGGVLLLAGSAVSMLWFRRPL
jgi:Ca-activated chloride channel family protein